MLAILSFIYCVFSLVSAVCPDTTGTFNFKFSDTPSPYSAGSNINIPVNERWLFDLTNSPNYGTIDVFGTLVFSDAQDVQLNVENIYVHNNASFLIGGCDCPYTHKAIIELQSVGNQNGNPYGTGVKTVSALSGGTILFYGELSGPSWTTLAVSADIGDTSITLSESVNWKIGDLIALAPTGYPTYQDVKNPYNWADQSDNVTITAISGATVTFTPALKYHHHSAIYHGVEETGEVARLTRNIVVRGNAASDVDGFGAHMMFLAGSYVQLSGIEVTRAGQFKHLGRYPVHWHMAGDVAGQFIFDSAIHNNYQRSVTVHGTHSLSIFRNVAYRTRGHMFFLEDGIEQNNRFAWNLGMIAYKIDKPNQLAGIASDDQPAIFWITNPNNTFEHNVAAGASDHCIWFAMPVNPTGPSNERYYVPRMNPLQKFAYNKVHSCGNDGLHIDNGPDQLGVPSGTDPKSITDFVLLDSNGDQHTISVGAGWYPTANLNQLTLTDYDAYKAQATSQTAYFDGFTAYKCRNRGVWIRGGNATFRHARMADNAIGFTAATGTYCMFQDGIMVRTTDNVGSPLSNYEITNGLYDFIDDNPSPPYRETPKNYPPVSSILPGLEMGPFYPRRGYEFYDGPNELKSSQFYGYATDTRSRSSAISMLRQDQFSISGSNRASGVYSDTTATMVLFPDLYHDGDKASVFLDLDGSVSGHLASNPGLNYPVIVNRHQFYQTAGCKYHSVQEVSVCPNHFVETRFSFDSPVSYPSNLLSMPGLVKIQRPDLVNTPMYLCGGPCNGGYEVNETLKPATSFFGTLMLYRDYYFSWMTSSVPAKFQFHIYSQPSTVNLDGLAPYNELVMAFCYPPGTTINTVMWNWKSGVKAATSLAAMRSTVYNTNWATLGDGMWYQDTATGWVYVRMIIIAGQNSTPIGGGTGAHMSIDATITQSPVACTVPAVADNSIPDTVRTIPAAMNTYLSAPAPFTEPAPPVTTRDSLPPVSCNFVIVTSNPPPGPGSGGPSDGGIGAGAIAGIVIGVLAAVFVAAAIGGFFYYQHTKSGVERM